MKQKHILGSYCIGSGFTVRSFSQTQGLVASLEMKSQVGLVKITTRQCELAPRAK